MYQVVLRRIARKGLQDLHPEMQGTVVKALFALQDNSRPTGCKKLQAGLGWSLRLGGYRIIYDIDDDSGTVDVRYIGPRGSAYRKP